MNSVDGFQITIHGKGSHGACPHQGIDPINIGVHIYLALQELIARESNPADSCVLTIGRFCAGEVANIIPETAILQGTLRTNNEAAREILVKRIREVVNEPLRYITEVLNILCFPLSHRLYAIRI